MGPSLSGVSENTFNTEPAEFTERTQLEMPNWHLKFLTCWCRIIFAKCEPPLLYFHRQRAAYP